MRVEVHSTDHVRLNAIAKFLLPEISGPVVLTFGALVLWMVSLPNVNIRQMTDIGLVSVMPPLIFIALLVLSMSFCLALRQRRLAAPILLFHIVALIFMLYGITTLVEEVPRFGPAWRHVGVIEYITRNGSVDPKIDAYFNWPGFFALGAFVTQIAGLPDAADFLPWSPVFLNLLYLGPLVMFLKSATDDKRLMWLGIWFFYLTNWIGQDYFSPQGFNYFLHLVIISILLTWFKIMPVADGYLGRYWRGSGFVAQLVSVIDSIVGRAEFPGRASRPWQRIGLLVMIIVIYTAIAASHQITPFFTLGAVMALVVLSRCNARGLPILMIVLVCVWIRFMAVTFFSGHGSAVAQHIGQVSDTVKASVTSRLQGSPGHVFVVHMRLIMTVAIWGLAFLGALRRLRNGSWDVSYALLAIVPFPILAFQAYGGEILLRAYLFALPPMVFFAAALFFTKPSIGASWWTTGAIWLVSIALLGGFLFTRYGNERMDNYSQQEVNAVKQLYQIARPDSLLAVGAHSTPWKFQDYEKYGYVVVTGAIVENDIDQLVAIMAERKKPTSYLLLTRSQRAHVELFSGIAPGAWEQFERKLVESGKFNLIFANQDAKIFVLVKHSSEKKP